MPPCLQTILVLAFVVLLRSYPSDAAFQPQAQADCPALTWKLPLTWMAGGRLQQTFNATACDRLVTRNDRYNCAPSQPWRQCSSDEQCPSGELCGEGMAPQLCVKCNMDKIAYTFYEHANISTNVTASMLAGNFWTTDEFYNHTGVDLILTLESWAWSPAMNALLHDRIVHHRSTWHDKYDSDDLRTLSEIYDQANATHTRQRRVSVVRSAYDRLDHGTNLLDTTSGTTYLPVA